MAHPVRGAGNDAADGRGRGKRDALGFAPGGKKHMELGLAEVGVKRAQPADFGDEPRVGLRGAFALGGAVLGGDYRDVAIWSNWTS